MFGLFLVLKTLQAELQIMFSLFESNDLELLLIKWLNLQFINNQRLTCIKPLIYLKETAC